MPVMNQVEMMQLTLLALSRRVERLESLERLSRVNGADAAEAHTVAMGLGYDGDIFVQAFKVCERKRLAGQLATKGWSATRIARVMGCTDRTAQRWLDGKEAVDDVSTSGQHQREGL